MLLGPIKKLFIYLIGGVCSNEATEHQAVPSGNPQPSSGCWNTFPCTVGEEANMSRAGLQPASKALIPGSLLCAGSLTN